MQERISMEHKQQFTEMKKNLAVIGVSESNFIKVELLFFNAIAVARTYGEDENKNGLLAAFKQLQYNQYQQTKALFKKSSQRESVIRRFSNCLKSVMTAAIRNEYVQQPQLT